MSKELIALAGDLVAERKRLSESLRRLEGTLTSREHAQALFKALGAGNADGVLSELDSLARSMDRLGALTKTLVARVNADRLETCEPLLADAVLTIEAVSSNLGRPVVVDCKSNEVKVDREILAKFRAIFLEMLETMVEYCVEAPKERLARRKRPKAYFQIDVKPLEGGYRLLVLCDGNGILPPLVADHGVRLAEIGVRASFEGKPGQWSSWRFHLPTGVGVFHGLPVRVGGRWLSIPAWSVLRQTKLEPGAEAHGPQRLWRLNEALERCEAEARALRDQPGWLVEIAAGTHTMTFVFDELQEPTEGYMKPLGELFNGQGRFLGVMIGEREELELVLNPAYLVYGGPAEVLPGTGAANPAAREETDAL